MPSEVPTHSLTGRSHCAAQDLLVDAFTSVLHDTPVYARKSTLAHHALCCWEKVDPPPRGLCASLKCPKNFHVGHMGRYYQRLGPLPDVTETALGTLVRTGRLHALMGAGKLFRSGMLPCASCNAAARRGYRGARWSALGDDLGEVLGRKAARRNERWPSYHLGALHCLGKHPDCLDPSRCACLPLPLRAQLNLSAAPFARVY